MPDRFLAFLLAGFLLLCTVPAVAQTQQHVKGQILEHISLQPISGALVSLQSDNSSYTTITDSIGRFQILVPIGRYQLRLQHASFEPYLQNGVMVHASRLSPLQLSMRPRLSLLEAVTIATTLPQASPALSSVSFSVEETQRTPGTFWDPARYIATVPGVNTTNDGANHLSVRGLPPWAVQWRLQDAPILNPNHLANAGTLQDRAGYAGGGVNILSGQLLDQSQFWQGYYPASFGNTIGGLFNMKLRPGKADKRHHTLQASLLGLDAATEGPLNKSGGSYLVNYRYSTVGLLSDLGVNFGNEKIHFQDLAFHIHLPSASRSKFSVFGMGGSSTNKLSPLEDATQWETERDALQVSYAGKMGAFGASAQVPLRGNTSLASTITFSARSDQRSEDLLTPDGTNRYSGSEQLTEYLLAANVKVQGIYRLFQWQAGLDASTLRSEGYSLDLAPALIQYYAGKINQTTLSPFVTASFALNQYLKADLGFRYTYWPSLAYGKPTPRFNVEWQILPAMKIWLQAGSTAQLLPSSMLIGQASTLGEKNIAPAKSMSLSLGQQWLIANKLTFATELYLQQISNVPASSTNPGITSLNYLDDLPGILFDNTGRAKIRGISAQLEHPFRQGYFFRLNGNWQHSSENAGSGKRALRYDPGWATTLLWGKEWQKIKTKGTRRIGVYGRTTLRGGYQVPAVDIEASQLALRTRYEYTSNKGLPGYFSQDLRLSHTREKPQYTRTLSLDLQNVTGRENIAGFFYDRLQQEVRPLKQLGLIPVLAYRVEF